MRLFILCGFRWVVSMFRISNDVVGRLSISIALSCISCWILGHYFVLWTPALSSFFIVISCSALFLDGMGLASLFGVNGEMFSRRDDYEAPRIS